MTTKYYALLTNLGAAKLANAAALGTQLQITQMAVGDGGDTLPTPNASQTKLIGEKRRAALNSLSIDAANSSQIIAEQVIPESEGGFWIREIGLFDADGVLIAVANCAETYKPQLQEGSGRTQTVRMILIVSSTDAVTLKIDPSIVLATRQYVDNAVIEVKAYADDLMAKHVAATDPHTQYAPKASPTLTGTPKAPTPAVSKNDTQIATTAFTQAVMKAHTDATDPHTQYAPKQSPAFTGGANVTGALVVSGGGSYGATLSLGYRQIFQRDGAPGYQTFVRSDVTAAPAADTEIGRVVFGYGMSGTDSWGTGGTLAYLNGIAQSGGGGKVGLYSLNSAAKATAGFSLDGKAGTIDVTGDVSFSGVVSFNGIINANRHDSCINFSSSDSTKPIIAMNYSAAGNFGFWDTTNSGWVLRKDVSNNWYMYSGLTVVGAATLGDGSSAVTQAKTDSSTKLATTAYVQSVNAPVGIPLPWPSETPPSGWLKCNGASFSATTYPELAKAYPSLKLPDLRGEFIRGWDDGRGVDSSRAILSSQAGAIETHSHVLGKIWSSSDESTSTANGAGLSRNIINVTPARSGVMEEVNSGYGLSIGFGAGGSMTSKVAVNPTGVSETRPRNLAFNYIVRAA